MRRALLAVVFTALLAACEVHVKGPEGVALFPEGEAVVVTLTSGETLQGELLEVTDSDVILNDHGRYVALGFAVLQQVQVKRYANTFDGSWIEKLTSYSRYPQGLTTAQRGRLLEGAGQKDFFTPYSDEMAAGKPLGIDTKAEPGPVTGSKTNQKHSPAGKDSGDYGQPALFDETTRMNWLVFLDNVVDLETAKKTCASIENGDRRRYRVPSLGEFEQLWKKYNGDARLRVFNKKEYLVNDEVFTGRRVTYYDTFSFAIGSSGRLYRAYLACVGQ